MDDDFDGDDEDDDNDDDEEDDEDDADGGVRVGLSNVDLIADSNAARLGKSPANVILAERSTAR